MTATQPAPCDEARIRSERCDDGVTKNVTGIIVATVLGSSLSYIDGSAVNVALPAIAAGLKAGSGGIQWIVNGYLLPLAALVLIGGALGDRLGRKRVFMAGLAIFTIATLACIMAPTLDWLIAARAGQGLGSALLVPTSLAILGGSFAGAARARAVGTWAAAGAIGGMLGPILGGLLTDTIGWRAIFAMLLPIALGAMWFGWRAIPARQTDDTAALDWIGAALATLGLGGLAWGLTLVSQQDYRIGALVALAGLAIFTAFVMVERRKRERAMMPLALFTTRVFTGITLLTFLLYAALGGVLLLVPMLLIGRGWSATAAGAAMLPLAVIMGLGSRAAGAFAGRIGARLPLIGGPIVAGIGFALFARVPGGDISFVAHILPAMTVLGIGMTLAVAPLTDTVLAAVDADHQGAASGVNNATARVASMLAVALAGFVIVDSGEGVALGAFHITAYVAAAMGVAGGLAAWRTIPARA